MKKIISMLMATVMLFSLSISAFADGVDIGTVIPNDKTYEEIIFEAPSASGYIITYPKDSPATTVVGQRYVYTTSKISGITVTTQGLSEDHDIRLEIASLTGNGNMLSETYTARCGEETEYEILYVSDAVDLYTVSVTFPEGASGLVTIEFDGPAIVNKLEDVGE